MATLEVGTRVQYTGPNPQHSGKVGTVASPHGRRVPDGYVQVRWDNGPQLQHLDSAVTPIPDEADL